MKKGADPVELSCRIECATCIAGQENHKACLRRHIGERLVYVACVKAMEYLRRLSAHRCFVRVAGAFFVWGEAV